MIRINLLQIKRKKKAKPLPSFVVIGVLVLVLVILGSVFIYISLNNKINRLQDEKRRNQAKIEELKKKVREVDDYEAKIRTFENRKKVIEDLKKNQNVPVMVLNEISFLLADGVWLDDMKIKGNDLEMKGYAFTNSNVVDLVNNLKRSPLFANVFLRESKETKVENVNVFRFTLKCNIRV